MELNIGVYSTQPEESDRFMAKFKTFMEENYNVISDQGVRISGRAAIRKQTMVFREDPTKQSVLDQLYGIGEDCHREEGCNCPILEKIDAILGPLELTKLD